MSDLTRTFCFDLDGTLCSNTDGSYDAATPFEHRIQHVNDLFAAGHHVTIFTARGSTTGIDWRDVTVAQLESWGVSYHELILGKPFAHVYVDDKAINSEIYDWQALPR